MVEELIVGDTIPPFHVKDHEGYEVTDEDVVGTPLVLYFYPKDETPGCTEEACSFRDNMGKFDNLHALVLGVSPDSVESHKKFLEKHKLPFSLLSDEKKDMCKMFDVLQDDNVVRTTFVINPRGIIRWIEKSVDVKGHTERVIKAIEEHCQEPNLKYRNVEKDYADFLQGSLGVTEDEKALEKKIMKEFGIKEDDLQEK
ncbi:MAG: putative peroxiredoxin bcp [Chlamydiae bacterium]|nr:putative peroxiredoxin bcp [Chlamydiota bacterium]